MDKIIDFLNLVTVVDVETTDIVIENAEIVELASCKNIDGTWIPASMLFGTIKPIPPEASAIHHISNKMVVGLSLFSDEISNVYDLMFINDTEYMVAHNSDYDRKVLEHNIKKTMNREPFIKFMAKEKWICTWRLAKALLSSDPNCTRHNLSYLRYYLDINVDDSTTAHRASDDTLVCGLLLEKLIHIGINNGDIDKTKDIGQQLYDLCWRPKEVKTWPFGKYKGVNLSDIPTDYYEWAINKPLDCFDDNTSSYDMDLTHSVMKVLEERIT